MESVELKTHFFFSDNAFSCDEAFMWYEEDTNAGASLC